MGVIRTVLGDVAADGLGRVAFHEHVLFDIVLPGAVGDRAAPIAPRDRWQIDYLSNVTPTNAHQQDLAIATAELVDFAAEGGSVIVDQTVGGLSRDPAGLAQAARATGVHVVAAAGIYTAPFLDDATRATPTEALAQRFIDEVQLGLEGTAIRAGIIGEIGCSWPLEPVEHRALIAAAKAQRATGAAISVHPGRHPEACAQILDILEQAGADLSRVVLCHMDRTHPDGTGIAPLLARGAVVEWDFFGIEQSHYWMADDVILPTDAQRLTLIAGFAQSHPDQILLSQDICTKTRLRQWGGHGYGHLIRNVPRLMTRLGFGAPLIDTLLRTNPLRLLTLTETRP